MLRWCVLWGIVVFCLTGAPAGPCLSDIWKVSFDLVSARIVFDSSDGMNDAIPIARRECDKLESKR